MTIFALLTVICSPNTPDQDRWRVVIGGKLGSIKKEVDPNTRYLNDKKAVILSIKELISCKKGDETRVLFESVAAPAAQTPPS